MKKLITMISLALIAFAVIPAQALQEREREELRQQLRDVKSWQIARELGLSDDQARRFVPLQENYDIDRDELRRERRRLESELESLVGDVSGNRERMRGVMLRIRDVDQRIAERERLFRGRAYRILNLEQQARYELFEKRFNAQIRNLIKDVRHRPTGDQRDSLKGRGDERREKPARDRRGEETRSEERRKSEERPSRNESKDTGNDEESTERSKR
jgi:hypothetical protein